MPAALDSGELLGVIFEHSLLTLLGLCMGWWLIRFVWTRVFYDLHRIPGPSLHKIVLRARTSIWDGELPMHKLYLEWVQEYGKVWKVDIFNDHLVFVCDPEVVTTQSLGWGAKGLPKSKHYEPFQRMLAPRGGAVFVGKHFDTRCKLVRRTIAQAFGSNCMRKAFPSVLSTFHAAATVIHQHINADRAFDAQDLSLRIVFDAIGKAGFGVQFCSVENGRHPLLDAILFSTADAMEDSIRPGVYTLKQLLPFLPVSRRSCRMLDQMDSELKKLSDAVFTPGAPDKDDYTMGACLKRLRNQDVKFTHDELVSELSSLVNAGTDTTGHQLGWLLCLVAAHPEVQRKLLEELKAAGLGPRGRDPEYADLAKLKYSKCVFQEALRFCPASATGGFRVTDHDMTVKGYRVPKGTFIVSPVYALNMAPWLWDEPEVFKPERWEPEGKLAEVKEANVDRESVNSKSNKKALKLWTFSYGPRDCVGQRFAVLELELALIVLCSKFWFELDERMGGDWEGCEQKMFTTMVITAKEGIWLRAKPHSNRD